MVPGLVNTQAILDAIGAGEAVDWEFKSARGGVPGSLWETYSAMANTDGGVILLGVEDDGTVSGLADPARIRQDIWNNLNNRGKVSLNLLTEGDAQVRELSGGQVLVLRIPRATRRQRPVHVGANPLTGTYRRNGEGDYHCRDEEVRRMLSDSSDEPFDSRVLSGYMVADLDAESIQQFRKRFASTSPTHSWLGLDDLAFLEKLEAYRRNRSTGQVGVTVAGLLMFGKGGAITAPEGIPQFGVDYRERLADDPQIRWTDRLTFDGNWECNLFQFYQKVMPKLFDGLKVPFMLDPATMARRDETPVHEALREAVANCLIHADYQGQGGIIIEKCRDHFEFSNPGYLLLSRDQLARGGVSESRNKSLQKMFALLGVGERAGSGLDKIRSAWQAQNWRQPHIEETERPDRVRLILSKISLVPENVLAALRHRWPCHLDSLSADEIQALVTAQIEKTVCNARLQELSTAHPADITKMLQKLAAAGFLEQLGQKRGAAYRINPEPEHSALSGNSCHSRGGTGVIPAGDSYHSRQGTPVITAGDSYHSIEEMPEDLRNQLSAAARPAIQGRLREAETRKIILAVCALCGLTPVQMGHLLKRDPANLRSRILKPLVAEGLLAWKYPDEPNRPDQAYRITPAGRKALGAEPNITKAGE